MPTNRIKIFHAQLRGEGSLEEVVNKWLVGKGNKIEVRSIKFLQESNSSWFLITVWYSEEAN